MTEELAAHLPPHMTKARSDPPQSYLLYTYVYRPDTGEFAPRDPAARCRLQYSRNALQIELGSRRYSVHRLIYKMLTGEDAPRGRGLDVREDAPSKEPGETGREFAKRLVAANKASNFHTVESYLAATYDRDFVPSMIDVIRDADTFMLNYDAEFAPELKLPSRTIQAEAYKARVAASIGHGPPGAKPVTQSNEVVVGWKRAADGFMDLQKLHGIHPLSKDFVKELPEHLKKQLLEFLDCRHKLDEWRTREMPVHYVAGGAVSAYHEDVLLVEFVRARLDRLITELTHEILDNYQSFDLPEPEVEVEVEAVPHRARVPDAAHHEADDLFGGLGAEFRPSHQSGGQPKGAAPEPPKDDEPVGIEVLTEEERKARVDALFGPEPQESSEEGGDGDDALSVLDFDPAADGFTQE